MTTTKNPSNAGASIDIRVRLLITLVMSVAILVLSQPVSLGILCFAGAIYMAHLRRFKLQGICYLALLVMAGFSMVFLKLLGLFIPMMRSVGPMQMLIPFLRMGAMLHVITPLALSMRMESVLSLMKTMRFPRALYLPLAVTIRFIPGLIDDARQVRDCLRLRGYRGVSLFNPRLWLLPMVFRALHLSDELAIAAELKGVGYGTPARIKARPFWNWSSSLAIMVLVLVLGGAAWIDRIASDAQPAIGSMAMAGGASGPARQAGEVSHD